MLWQSNALGRTLILMDSGRDAVPWMPIGQKFEPLFTKYVENLQE